jgi:hypothetical protein
VAGTDPSRPNGNQANPRALRSWGSRYGVLLVALAAAACGGGSATSPAVTAKSATTTVPPTTTTDPGLLPQTSIRPPIDTSLQTTLAPLWSALAAGTPSTGLPVFFPENAYLQMKAGELPDPASDYADRLIAFYNLDIPAYHQALGAGASTARLLRVEANAADASWIAPGSCENKVGYWHLPGVRLVYQEGGATQSFAVASLISWRGVWYVVHLGPNPRPSDVGTVDQPATGAGAPGPAGGC